VDPYRLPRHVVPTRYDLRLEPDFTTCTFAGVETVTVTVCEPTSELVLNVAELQVSEAAITEAVRFLFERAKLVVEPSGALGVAAILAGKVELTGRAGVVLSGGNVDAAVFAAILDGRLP